MSGACVFKQLIHPSVSAQCKHANMHWNSSDWSACEWHQPEWHERDQNGSQSMSWKSTSTWDKPHWNESQCSGTCKTGAASSGDGLDWPQCCGQGVSGVSNSLNSPGLPVNLAGAIEDRDGEPYCLICNRGADEAHLGSRKHKSNMEWLRRQPDPEAALRKWVDEHRSEALSCVQHEWHAAMLHEDGPPLEPPGLATWYEWHPDQDKFFCRLCQAYADEKHIGSQRHQCCSQYPDSYLRQSSQVAALGWM